jgi:hypothetical protein
MFSSAQSVHFPDLTALSPVADVVHVLSHHDPKRVKAAAQLIVEQCDDVPAKRAAYVAARAIPTLLDALQAHPDRACVQETVCRALWSNCGANDDIGKVFRSYPHIIILFVAIMTDLCFIQIAIREAFGIDLILLASKNHVANVNVQDAVCGVLRNVSITASNKVSRL